MAIFELSLKEKKLKGQNYQMGKSTIFMEGIYQNMNESLELNAKNEKINIENKGNVIQDNLKEIYEDALYDNE